MSNTFPGVYAFWQMRSAPPGDTFTVNVDSVTRSPLRSLPLATTEESYHWTLVRDDAFPRFLDIFNHRFLQLFYRAWADARPIAQHDRPDLDRFAAYIGSMIGVGSKPYLKRDSVPDAEKLAHAGLIGAQAKSASRLRRFLAGLFKADIEIEQFTGILGVNIAQS